MKTMYTLNSSHTAVRALPLKPEGNRREGWRDERNRWYYKAWPTFEEAWVELMVHATWRRDQAQLKYERASDLYDKAKRQKDTP